MILWKEAITDRTQADIDKAKELFALGWGNMTLSQKAEYIKGLKGALNKSDLERIENNIQLLSDVLELDLDTGYGKIPQLIPTESYFVQMLNNVDEIREAYARYDDTPATPTDVTRFTNINDIEQILLDVYTILSANFYNYTGELYSGEILGLPI